jgi:hypothetical protein
LSGAVGCGRDLLFGSLIDWSRRREDERALLASLRHPALRLPEVFPEAASLYLTELGIIQVTTHLFDLQ